MSESKPVGPTLIVPQHAVHSRLYHDHRYVYPVVSRRSQGVSIGINLNPDKVCNFDCIYCQVDRRSESETRFVDLARLLDELRATIRLVVSGQLFEDPTFQSTPAHLRRLNDLAFSGDGEPTSFRNVDEIVSEVAQVKKSEGLDSSKLVLITNASLFHRPVVQRALAVLDANHGEIWAKLDAGTASYFEKVERTRIPFQRILDNLDAASRIRPLVIQSLFMTIDGEGPPESEIEAYCERLQALMRGRRGIDRVQVYTVARRPAEAMVGPLENAAVERIAERVRSSVGVPVEAYYGIRS